MRIRETDELFAAVAAELEIPDPKTEDVAAELGEDEQREDETSD